MQFYQNVELKIGNDLYNLGKFLLIFKLGRGQYWAQDLA